MKELTLESLAKRLDAVEQKLAEQVPASAKDWRRILGTSEDNEFTRAMWADMEATREADREAARRGEEL
jgi:hypothetical protein